MECANCSYCSKKPKRCLFFRGQRTYYCESHTYLRDQIWLKQNRDKNNNVNSWLEFFATNSLPHDHIYNKWVYNMRIGLPSRLLTHNQMLSIYSEQEAEESGVCFSPFN